MTEQKQAVADCMNRLSARGLTSTSGGNVSLRVSEDRILLNSSTTDNGNMTSDQIVEIGLDGNNHALQLKPSGEILMHINAHQMGGFQELNDEQSAALADWAGRNG